MSLLKQKIKEKEQFYKVLAIAISANLLFIGIFAAACYFVKDITVTVNGRTAQHKTIYGNVNDLLDSWDVTLDKNDKVESGKNGELKDGSEVIISTYEIKKEVVTEETPYKTEKSYTSDLMEGKSKVTTEGKRGKDKVTYKVSYLGEEEQSREEIDRETIKKPVTEKIEVGTAISYNGEKYSKKITVVSTGYTHTGNRTATGTYPHRGTMAVDRGVIPMGSYGYVPGYGEVHAEDTGGAIKGNRIDLFFETRGQAVSWGRRTVTLYLK